jgi:hypothetical protein
VRSHGRRDTACPVVAGRTCRFWRASRDWGRI